MTQLRTSRRIVFHGLGALGVAVALAGCGGGDDATAGPGTGGSTSPEPASGTPTSEATSEAPAEGLVPAADVPVGGGVVLTDAQLVVVQPTEGEFKAYSAICTHVGTPVDQVDGTEIVCPDHGSRFSIDDGSAVQGPATAPLAEVAVRLQGDQVVLV